MSARPMVLEIYRSAPGWRWRVRAGNHRILADSGEAYQRLRDCAYGAGLVIGVPTLDAALRVGSSDQFTLPNGQTWRVEVSP